MAGSVVDQYGLPTATAAFVLLSIPALVAVSRFKFSYGLGFKAIDATLEKVTSSSSSSNGGGGAAAAALVIDGGHEPIDDQSSKTPQSINSITRHNHDNPQFLERAEVADHVSRSAGLAAESSTASSGSNREAVAIVILPASAASKPSSNSEITTGSDQSANFHVLDAFDGCQLPSRPPAAVPVQEGLAAEISTPAAKHAFQSEIEAACRSSVSKPRAIAIPAADDAASAADDDCGLFAADQMVSKSTINKPSFFIATSPVPIKPGRPRELLQANLDGAIPDQSSAPSTERIPLSSSLESGFFYADALENLLSPQLIMGSQPADDGCTSSPAGSRPTACDSQIKFFHQPSNRGDDFLKTHYQQQHLSQPPSLSSAPSSCYFTMSTPNSATSMDLGESIRRPLLSRGSLSSSRGPEDRYFGHCKQLPPASSSAAETSLQQVSTESESAA